MPLALLQLLSANKQKCLPLVRGRALGLRLRMSVDVIAPRAGRERASGLQSKRVNGVGYM